MPKSFQNRQLQPGGVIKDTYEQINLNSAEINADLVELYEKEATATARTDSHVNGSAEKHAAESIVFTPSESITATETQSAIEQVNERVSNIISQSGTSDTEVVDARNSAQGGVYPSLKDRLDGENNYLTEKINELNVKRFYHLDAYNKFFNGSENDFVSGQRTTSTFTTAQADIGSNIIQLDDVTNLSAGVVLVCNVGTENQQLITVISISSKNVTISPILTSIVPNGSIVSPIWVNASHLTSAGLSAWGYWFANAKDENNNFILQGPSPKITLFGDSWISQDPSVLSNIIKGRLPNAVVLNIGVGGDKSIDMIDRFEVDVPIDSDYVVFNEPGVNDIYGQTTLEAITSNLETLVKKIRNIGAIPIFTGIVPLSEHITRAKTCAGEMSSIIQDGTLFPAITPNSLLRPVIPESGSIGIGKTTMLLLTSGIGNTSLGDQTLLTLTSGSANTVLGKNAGRILTSGNSNTAIGNNALQLNQSGHGNLAIGQGALANTTTGSNTAIGTLAGFSQTTGSPNVFIGFGAGYQSGGSATTDATVNGSAQTIIGYQAGSSPSANHTTAIGFKAKASGLNSTAIGSEVMASAAGSAALFRDSANTPAQSNVQDEVSLGTSLHRIKIVGKLNIASKTPIGTSDNTGVQGDITWDDNFVYVKTSNGWKRATLQTW